MPELSSVRRFSGFEAGDALGERLIVGDLLDSMHHLFMTGLGSALCVLETVIHALLKRIHTCFQLTQLRSEKILDNCSDVFDNAHRGLRILSDRSPLEETFSARILRRFGVQLIANGVFSAIGDACSKFLAFQPHIFKGICDSRPSKSTVTGMKKRPRDSGPMLTSLHGIKSGG